MCNGIKHSVYSYDCKYYPEKDQGLFVVTFNRMVYVHILLMYFQ